MSKLKNQGAFFSRTRRHPEEKRFAEAWDAVNGPDSQLGETPVLNGLVDSTRVREPALFERRLAATIVQWLGSPVGNRFLLALGYERVRNGPTGLSRFERTPEGHINNCALANDEPESTCQVCCGRCPDRSKFP